MLPKAHVTLHSRMSGSRWVSHHGSYLGHEVFFLYSSVYSCHFILISSASGKHYKIKIQKWANFCYNSFFLIGSNNLKNNYNLKFCCWYHFKINLKNTTPRKEKKKNFKIQYNVLLKIQLHWSPFPIYIPMGYLGVVAERVESKWHRAEPGKERSLSVKG